MGWNRAPTIVQHITKSFLNCIPQGHALFLDLENKTPFVICGAIAQWPYENRDELTQCLTEKNLTATDLMIKKSDFTEYDLVFDCSSGKQISARLQLYGATGWIFWIGQIVS